MSTPPFWGSLRKQGLHSISALFWAPEKARFVAWPLELGLGTHNPRFVAWPLELGLGTHNPRFVAWPLELGLGTLNPLFVAWPLEVERGKLHDWTKKKVEFKAICRKHGLSVNTGKGELMERVRVHFQRLY